MNERNLEYLPKKRALAAQVETVVFPLLDHPMSAWDKPGMNGELNLSWHDDYTLAENVLIGLSVGANLPWGTCSEIVRSAFDAIGEDARDDWTDWFTDKIIKPLEKNNIVQACRELNNVSARYSICGAVRIGSLKRCDITEKIIEIVTEAMDAGYEQ